MANLITVVRVICLFVVIGLMYVGDAKMIEMCAIAIAVVIIADALDGWVARKRNEVNQFGAIFDIVGDRIVENALWIAFAHLGLIPVWVPLMVMTRGFLVDGLRSASYEDGMTPFGDSNLMRSPISQWLTAGRFMRALFGFAKAAGFVFLAGLLAYQQPDAGETFVGWLYSFVWVRGFGWSLVWTAVVLTVVRAIPVIVDASAYIRAKDAAVAAAATEA